MGWTIHEVAVPRRTILGCISSAYFPPHRLVFVQSMQLLLEQKA